MLLCLATNGLNLLPYIDELVKIDVSHVTITINAVDLEIAAKVYSWIRFNKRVRKSIDGVETLLTNQLAAIKELKKHDVIVKVNSIIIPGINDEHISEIAKTVSELGVDIFNPIPLYKNPESAFGHIDEPSKAAVLEIRKQAGEYLPQMHHCTRCRADAVGKLGDEEDAEMMQAMKDVKKSNCETVSLTDDNSYTAVASMEGVLVNQHLGEATELSIFKWDGDEPKLIEKRSLPQKGSGNERWLQLAEIIQDCGHLMVSGIGEKPRLLLEENGISIHLVEGIIEAALHGIYKGSGIAHMQKREKTTCGQSCSGSATGCC